MIKGVLTDIEIRNLYLSADYFLCASKGEGWCLPLIEAIACGTPTICCEFGGQSEYLSTIQDKYISLPYSLGAADMKFGNSDFFSSSPGQGMWAEISVEDIANAFLLASKSNYLEKAKQASIILRSEFSWENSTKKLLDFIFKIEKEFWN